MKLFNTLIITLILLSQTCKGQNAPTKFYSEDFKWTIEIPKDFVSVSEEESKENQMKGMNALEKTTGEELIDQSTSLFFFKTDDMNNFEANYQPYDIEIDGNYLETFNDVNKVLHQTFVENMPKAQIDTLTTKEKISGLDFNKFEMKIKLPNQINLTMMMFSRLFDKKEFSVVIMFMDPKRGMEMLDAWRKSNFKK